MDNKDLKEQLLSRVDDIVSAIMNDKIVEIKKEKGIIQIFEVSKKKLVKIKNNC